MSKSTNDAPPRRRASGGAGIGRRSGQALLETLIAALALLLLLSGLLQLALVSGGREILRHAAARAARARSVGFNDWMAQKAMRVAAIPVSGRMTFPGPGFGDEGGGADAGDFELARIPGYLAAENHSRAAYELSYEEWERGAPRLRSESSPYGHGTVRFAAAMDYPLRMPFASLLAPWAERDEEGVPRLGIEGVATAPDHSALYLSGAD